jgi:tetratricopeptide (TPR) repeat protein
MLEEYDGLDQSAKNEILAIVNGPGSFVEKEDALHKLPSYNEIFKNIYPELRAAKTEILTVTEKRSDAEISVLARQISQGSLAADTLSYGELAYAAYLTPSLQEKAAIYEATVKTYGNWAAHNNLGAVYLEMASRGEGDMNSNVEKALTQLEISARMKDNPYAQGNMAIAEAMQGNKEKAYETITGAVDGNLPSDAVYAFNSTKGALEINRAMYDDAVKTLSNATETADNHFNRGLAQILAKDYQNAMITFEQLTDENPEYAMGYYGAAIAAARLNQADEVIDNVSKAIAADASLKSEIAGDLEFDAYTSNSDFISAVR